MGIKQWIEDWKETNKIKKEIAQKQRKAYLEEMKKQSVEMGKKQATLEAKYRENIYSEKLKFKEKQKKMALNNRHSNSFGLNNKGSSKKYNWITGEYED